MHSPVTRKPTVSFSAADDEPGSDYTPVSMFTDANNHANANSAPAHHAVHQGVSVNANSEINSAASQDANDDNWFEPKIDFAGLDDLIKQDEPVNPRAAESSSAPAHQSNQAAGMSTSAFSRKPGSVDAAFDVDDVLPSFGSALADDPFMPASGSASAGLQAASLAGMVAAGAASAATSAPAAAATASAVAGGVTAFGFADSGASDTETPAARPQVKPNVPEMPRPNPVKIPTRRTLASLGIKLPSERMAEQREREMLEQREREQAERQRAEEALAKEKSLIPGVEIPSFFNALEDDTSAFSFSARDDEPQVSVRPASAAAESNAAGAASEISPTLSTSPVSPAANAAASSYAARGVQVAEEDDEDSRMPSFSAIQDDRDESVANERFAADAQADDDESDEDAQFNARLRAEFEAREQERLARAVEAVRRPLQTETSALVRPQTSREPVAPTHATSNPMTHTAAPFTFEPVREEPSMDDSVNDEPAAAPHAFASKPSTSSASAFMPATESAAAFTPAGKAEPEQDDANDEANSEQQFHAAEIMRMRKRAEQEHMAFSHPFLMPQEDVMPKPTTPLPTLDLLAEPPRNNMPVSEQELEMTARLVEARLNDYRIKADVAEISPGP
ncbi:MAG: DNA translocase FtsK, partial [Plesiomonas shigelloides]